MNQKTKLVLAVVLGLAAIGLLAMNVPKMFSSEVSRPLPKDATPEQIEVHKAATAKEAEQLYELVVSENPKVASAAVKRLSERFQTKRTYDTLLNMSRTQGAAPEVRQIAVESLGDMPQVEPAVFEEILNTADEPEVREGALKGFIRSTSNLQIPWEKKNALVPSLVKALRDPDMNVRAQAYKAIHKLTLAHFSYDPRKPATEQMDAIRQIEAKLRKRKLL